MISIITINYNNADGLCKTIQSVIAQTYQEFEYIIVDGASTDGSIDVIHDLLNVSGTNGIIPLRGDKRGAFVSEPDTGIYNAMNKGIRMATGEYCLFLNSGDCLAHDRVLQEVMLLGLEADIVAANAIFDQSVLHEERLIISPERVRASDLILGYLPHQATFIRRALFEEIHPYDETNKVVSDWAFFIEALLIHHKKYQHIQLFVAHCETEGISNQPSNNALMDEEFHRNLQKIAPCLYDDFVELRKARREANDSQTLFMKKLQRTFCYRVLWGLRKRLLQCGFYEWNNQRKQKKFFKRLIREDATLKKEILQKIEALPDNLLANTQHTADWIVSMTSYGKRVTDALPFALYSLLTQTLLPKRIVVYLDNDNWSDKNLLDVLQTLKRKGIEFYFCEDIRSFKKLIPALQMFPDETIMTVDDDFYYNPNYMEWMQKAYEQSDKKTVLGSWGCIVEKRNGKFIPYSEWRDCKYGNDESEYSMFGCCCCYPPHIFDDEILKKEVFMELCPTADDLWFWAMERRQGIPVKMIEPHGYGLHRPVNRIEEYDMQQTGTLFWANVTGGRNDEQLCALIDKYNLQ